MYGTIAKMKLNPGVTPDQLIEVNRAADETPELIGLSVYQADGDPTEVWMSVVFSSEEAYKQNAASPGQDERYRQMRALLAADPEWHDGTVVSITQDRLQGDWYVEVIGGDPKIHRLNEALAPTALPAGVPPSPPGSAVLQWGPDGKLYRLQGSIDSSAMLDAYEL